MSYEPTDATIAWQLARMDADATEADARAALIEAQIETALIIEAPAMLEALRDALSASEANDGDSLMNAIAAFRPIIARIDGDDDDDQVCRNGKLWADCTCC
jgi:hypothetical protein